MRKQWMGAAVFALAISGCGGPLEEESMDAVAQRQAVRSPNQLFEVDGDEQPIMMREGDIIRQFQKPSQEDRLRYKVHPGGDCSGGH